MTSRKILLLESGSLPGAGLYSLLSEIEDVEVRTTKLANLENLVQAIDAFRPHVFVLDEADLIEVKPTLCLSLRRASIQRIIIIHWEENEIEVYDSHRVEIKELTDFLAML